MSTGEKLSLLLCVNCHWKRDDPYRPVSRAQSRCQSRLDYVPLRHSKVAASTQTEYDPVDLPALQHRERATMTQEYDDDRPATAAAAGVTWGMPEDYEATRTASPSPAQHHYHHQSHDEAAAGYGRPPPNNYYQRIVKYSTSRPPHAVPIAPSYGKPSGLMERRDPGPPPTFRCGRLGAPWRHIRQTTGNLGNHICFVDGGVKEGDMRQYPPFGYARAADATRHSMPKFRSAPAARPAPNCSYNNKQLRSIFQRHAKNGFKYWYEDNGPMKVPAKQTIQGRMMKMGVGY